MPNVDTFLLCINHGGHRPLRPLRSLSTLCNVKSDMATVYFFVGLFCISNSIDGDLDMTSKDHIIYNSDWKFWDDVRADRNILLKDDLNNPVDKKPKCALTEHSDLAYKNLTRITCYNGNIIPIIEPIGKIEKHSHKETNGY